MLPTFLLLHSILRWVVLGTLLFAVFRAWQGLKGSQPYAKADKLARTLSVVAIHIQLLVGLALFGHSPSVKAVFAHGLSALGDTQTLFFAVIHTVLMLAAVVLVTIGSAKARRAQTDSQRHGLVLRLFGLALTLILVAIPWPGLPWGRPWIR